MNGRKMLSKTVLTLGAVAAVGMSAPAFAASLINMESVAVPRSNGATLANAYGDQLFNVSRWNNLASIATQARSSSQTVQATTTAGLGSMPAASPIASFGGAADAPGSTMLRPNSAVFYDAVGAASNFQLRFGSIPAGRNFNLDFNVPGNGFGLLNVPVNAPGLSVASGNIATATTAQVAAVPEPATWLMLLVGFGLSGFVLRHRKASTQNAFA